MAETVTVTITDSQTSQVVPDAKYWITSDEAGTTVLFEEYTSTAGIATFSLDAGTYYGWGRKAGKAFPDNPDTITVVASAVAVAVECEPVYLDASGETQICNMAILRIGSAGGALDVTGLLGSYEGTPATTKQQALQSIFQVAYPEARRTVHLAGEWPYPFQVYALPGAALDSDDENTAPDWEYFYSRPTGCLSFVGVVDAARVGKWVREGYLWTHEEWRQYEEAFYPHAEIGDQIACDYTNSDEDNPSVLFKFVQRVTDTTKYPQPFRETLAAYLAWYVCRPMGQDKKVRDGLWIDYKQQLHDALGQTRRSVYVPKRNQEIVDIW